MKSGKSTPSVRLPRADRITPTFNALLAVVGWVCIGFAVRGLVQRAPATIACLAIPPAFFFFGRWLASFQSGDYAVLHPNRMELRGDEDIVWQDVVGIIWPRGDKQGDNARPMKIRIRDSEEQTTQEIEVQLCELGLADKITMVQYIRHVAGNCEQENWAEFCHRSLIPAVERLRSRQATEDDHSRVARQSRFHELRSLLGSCFLAPLILVGMVSRKVYLATASTIAISAFINVRLAWGAWLSPFTELLFGFSLACVVAAVITPRRGKSSSREPGVPLSVTLWYVSVAILLPFLASMFIQGRLAAPMWLAPLGRAGAQLLTMLGIYGPLFYAIWKHQLREKRLKPLLHADAQRRWKVFTETGELPAEDGTVAGVR